jgi:hypothetical protein
MHYFRLTGFWVAAFFALGIGFSTLSPFGLSSASPLFVDSTIYPTFRFYRGGAYASVTESTLGQVFHDRLIGVPNGKDISKRLAKHLYKLCIHHRMDPAFVLSVIQAESSFRADVVSSAGAVGLMQVMPATARVVAGRRVTAKALLDPFLNLELGVKYLRQLRDRYSGLSPYYALAAYNMGPSRLDALRAKPTFKPTKTLRYFEDIMRGVGDWRRYGAHALSEVSAIPEARSALKAKANVELENTGKPRDSA